MVMAMVCLTEVCRKPAINQWLPTEEAIKVGSVPSPKKNIMALPWSALPDASDHVSVE